MKTKKCLKLYFILLVVFISSLFGAVNLLAKETKINEETFTIDSDIADFTWCYGIKVKIGEGNLFNSDKPSIANFYVDYFEINGLTAENVIANYDKANPHYGINYSFSDNNLYFFVDKTKVVLTNKITFLFKKGFPLKEGVLSKDKEYKYDPVTKIWKEIGAEIVIENGIVGFSQIVKKDADINYFSINLEKPLAFVDNQDVTSLYNSSIKINDKLIKDMTNATVIYKKTLNALEISVNNSNENKLSLYTSNTVELLNSFKIENATLGKDVVYIYNNINSSWDNHIVSSTSIEPNNDLAGTGVGIFQHENGLLEIQIKFTKDIRIGSSFETFIQNQYWNYININGATNDNLKDILQIHYEHSTFTMTMYVLTSNNINFDVNKNNKITISGDFPVLSDEIINKNYIFDYSATSKKWTSSTATFEPKFIFGISNLESDNGIITEIDNYKSLNIGFSKKIIVNEAFYDICKDSIFINGYKLSQIVNKYNEKVICSYNEEKNYLNIKVPNDTSASLSEDNNKILFFKNFQIENFVKLKLNVEFTQNGKNWEVEEIDEVKKDVVIIAPNDSINGIYDYGYFYGVNLKFSFPIRASLNVVANLETLIQDDYLDCILLNGIPLSNYEGITQINYNVTDYTLILYIAKDNFDIGVDNIISLTKDFPLLDGVLKKQVSFTYHANVEYWTKQTDTIRDFNDDFSNGLKYWNKLDGEFQTENGILSNNGNGRLIRNERAGNFNYKANIKLCNETSKFKMIFKTTKSMYGGYEVVIEKNKISLVRRNPFEIAESTKKILAEKEFNFDLNKFYNIRINTQDTFIYIYIDDSVLPILNVYENSTPSGYFGLIFENANMEVKNISVSTNKNLTAKNVALSLTMPQQLPNQIRIKLPTVPAGFIVEFNSSNKNVIDRNGIITLPISDTECLVVLKVINRLDYSQYLTEKLLVTIPKKTVDEDKEYNNEFKVALLAELNKIVISSENFLQNYKDLNDIINSLNRFDFKKEDRIEFDKTITIAKSILNKGLNKIQGIDFVDKYNFTAGLQSIEELLTQTKEILNTILSTETFPFSGLFAEDFGNTVDFALYFDEDTATYHIFYIRGTAGYMWAEMPTNYFGHAISKDLISWTVVQPVIYTSIDGDDSYQVWAPQVEKINGLYYMFYTAVSTPVTQSIKIAKSNDLYNWEKCSEIPGIKSGSWGSWDEDKWSDCRDPGILIDGEMVYLYYTAKAENIGFVMGIKSSKITDMVNWKDEGYTILPQGTATPPESISVVKKDGEYHMFHTDYARGIVHLKSNDPLKGWKLYDDWKQLASPGSASEIVHNTLTDKWYWANIQHYPYSNLHFTRFKEVKWLEDNSIILKDIGDDFTIKLSNNVEGNGLYTFADSKIVAGYILFNEVLRVPVGTITGSLELNVHSFYQDFILFNGKSIKEINNETAESIQMHYNMAQLRLEFFVIPNATTELLNFKQIENNTITLKKGMSYGIGKTLTEDITYNYSKENQRWTIFK